LSRRTLYVKILQEQANALSEFLEISGNHPSSCHCCVTKRPRKALSVMFNTMVQSTLGRLRNTATRSAPPGQTPSKAAKAYTPASDSTSATSSSTISPTPRDASAPSTASPSNSNKDHVQIHGSSSRSASPTGHIPPTRIIFGIQGARRSLEIEQIDVIAGQMNDQLFFSELRIRHRTHRSWVRRLMSPFRFRHCNFVKVSTF
jgi:hypothetical protein